MDVRWAGQAADTRGRRSLLCDCSEELLEVERQRQGVEWAQLTANTTFQRDMLQLQHERLDLQNRQQALAEAQSEQPSISVLIILLSPGRLNVSFVYSVPIQHVLN